MALPLRRGRVNSKRPPVKDPVGAYISTLSFDRPPKPCFTPYNPTIDTSTLLSDMQDPDNAYILPPFYYHGEGYWPDDVENLYKGTLFDEIWRYGKVDIYGEEEQQAEIGEIIGRLGVEHKASIEIERSTAKDNKKKSTPSQRKAKKQVVSDGLCCFSHGMRLTSSHFQSHLHAVLCL